MTPNLNLKRAAIAEQGVAKYAEAVNADATRQAIQDLVCDIGHLCDREELDFQKIIVTAVGWWHAERIDPEGILAGPCVTLSVDETEVASW